MNDSHTVPQNTMSLDLAKLIVEQVQNLQAAYFELDEATDAAALLREQRSVLMQRVNELEKRVRRQDERIAALADDNRALRAVIAEWQKAAA